MSECWVRELRVGWEVRERREISRNVESGSDLVAAAGVLAVRSIHSL
jgi:hypothetical protein